MPPTTVVKLDLARDASFSTTISKYLISASGYEGRTKSLDPMRYGTAIVKLNNEDGRFSPKNTGSPYYPDFDDNYRGIRIEAGNRKFTGYIVKIEQDPFVDNQEVTLHCVNRLGLMAPRGNSSGQTLSVGRFRHQPVHLVLNRLIDLLEQGEEIDNPGGEDTDGSGSGNTTGYSAAASGTTISAPATIPFEGDYCIQAVCDGSVSGQGIRFDLGAEQAEWKVVSLFFRTAPGDGDASLLLRGLSAAFGTKWSTTISAKEDEWTYKQEFILSNYDYRYIEIITTAAVQLTILSDGLHQIPFEKIIPRSIPTTLDAQVEQLALYNAPALEALTRVVATEAGGVLYMGNYTAYYGTIYASAQVVRDGKSTPDATFGDDNTNVPYKGLRYAKDAGERVSRVEVFSEGDYSDDGEEVTVWDLSPAPLDIPASSTAKLRAEYASPARNCKLNVSAIMGRVFTIEASADDGMQTRAGSAYPPTGAVDSTTVGFLQVGQYYDGSTYRKRRSYLRFDTSSIGAGETPTSAKLRLKVSAKQTGVAFNVEARQPGGSSYDWSPLDSGDWSSSPGSDTKQGEVASGDLPPADFWAEIDLDVAAINKTGWSAFYLISSRDTNGNAPSGDEFVAFYPSESESPELIVYYPGSGPVTAVFRNYGAGADIELSVGSEPLSVGSVTVTGIQMTTGSERSMVFKEGSAQQPATLPPYHMPHQGTRTADMDTQAQFLLTRYNTATPDLLKMRLEELDSASLTQMENRNLDDLIRIINTKFAFSTKIDGNFFIEGLRWEIAEQGKVLKVALDVEEK